MPDELGGAAGLPRLVEALRSAGHDDDSLALITHRNWLRVLGETWHPWGRYFRLAGFEPRETLVDAADRFAEPGFAVGPRCRHGSRHRGAAPAGLAGARESTGSGGDRPAAGHRLRRPLPNPPAGRRDADRGDAGAMDELVAAGKVRAIGSSNLRRPRSRGRPGLVGARALPVRGGPEPILAARPRGRARPGSGVRAARDRADPVLPARERAADGQVQPRRAGPEGARFGRRIGEVSDEQWAPARDARGVRPGAGEEPARGRHRGAGLAQPQSSRR